MTATVEDFIADIELGHVSELKEGHARAFLVAVSSPRHGGLWGACSLSAPVRCGFRRPMDCLALSIQCIAVIGPVRIGYSINQNIY